MDGSNDKYGVTINDVFALISGSISEDKRKQLAKAVYDPEHPLSYLARQSSKDEPFIEDWPPKDIPPEIQQLLNDSDEPEGSVIDDGAIAESAYADIQPYLTWEREQLEAALIADLPDEYRADTELVYRSGQVVAWHFLEPYSNQIQAVVRDSWNWPELKRDGRFTSDEETAASLASCLRQEDTGLPFNPLVLAVALLRFGLDRIAGIK